MLWVLCLVLLSKHIPVLQDLWSRKLKCLIGNFCEMKCEKFTKRSEFRQIGPSVLNDFRKTDSAVWLGFYVATGHSFFDSIGRVQNLEIIDLRKTSGNLYHFVTSPACLVLSEFEFTSSVRTNKTGQKNLCTDFIASVFVVCTYIYLSELFQLITDWCYQFELR